MFISLFHVFFGAKYQFYSDSQNGILFLLILFVFFFVFLGGFIIGVIAFDHFSKRNSAEKYSAFGQDAVISQSWLAFYFALFLVFFF